MSSVIEVLAEYEDTLRRRHEQYQQLKSKGDLTKAGEVLWSIIMTLLSLISLITRGNPLARHTSHNTYEQS